MKRVAYYWMQCKPCNMLDLLDEFDRLKKIEHAAKEVEALLIRDSQDLRLSGFRNEIQNKFDALKEAVQS